MDEVKHVWSFSTVGGVKRVNLESGADLYHLRALDQKLWTALACPVEGLEIDERTLKLIDKDNDGQIRVPEVLQAVDWILSVLDNPDYLLKQDNVLPLKAINTGSEEGRRLLASAKIILNNLGKPDEDKITVDDTSDIERIFALSPLNGDGIITEDTVKDERLTAVLNDIIASVGGILDRGGKMGINEELLSKFEELGNQYTAWLGSSTNVNQPFGADTAGAYDVFNQVREKIEDYFYRCKMAAYNGDSSHLLNVSAAQVEGISPKNFNHVLDEVSNYPLALVGANKPLPLNEGVNPAWQETLVKFKQAVTDKLFNQTNELSEQQWQKIKSVFEPYQTWLTNKQGAEVEGLGIDRVKAILQSNDIAVLRQFIADDTAVEAEANSIILVDQLVRYYRDLYTLLKNFVTFYDFYSPGYRAIFEAGILFIDQRSCHLCLKVTDMDKHNTMASFSGMFLIYCECVSRATNEKMTIAAALTNGDIDNLVVGRNAIFYDRKGLDWDATVIKIIDNPISMKQAFWSPYRKVSRFIENQINKVAAAQDSKVTEDVTKGIENTSLKNDAPKTPPQPFDVGKFVGIFAAIGLALGAIGTALASVVAGFMGLTWWKMPFAILGILLLISGPAMIMAYLKLRKRNLAPILDANGWAINASAVVNIQFGNTLTQLAELPKGAKVNINDPFTKKGRPLWPMVIAMVLAIGLIIYLLQKNGLIQIHF
jgi:hypothetical protein